MHSTAAIADLLPPGQADGAALTQLGDSDGSPALFATVVFRVHQASALPSVLRAYSNSLTFEHDACRSDHL